MAWAEKRSGDSFFSYSCFPYSLLSGCKPRAQYLGKDEISNYQGTPLSVLALIPQNSIKGTPNIDINSYRLLVDGLVTSPLSYTYDQVLSKPHFTKLIVLHCVDGWNATVLWEGVKIADLIQPADVSPKCNTLIFHCADGYTTSLPLAYIRDNNILLAFNANGTTLPNHLGYPFIVVAEDKLWLQVGRVGNRDRTVGQCPIQRLLGVAWL